MFTLVWMRMTGPQKHVVRLAPGSAGLHLLNFSPVPGVFPQKTYSQTHCLAFYQMDRLPTVAQVKTQSEVQTCLSAK